MLNGSTDLPQNYLFIKEQGIKVWNLARKMHTIESRKAAKLARAELDHTQDGNFFLEFFYSWLISCGFHVRSGWGVMTWIHSLRALHFTIGSPPWRFFSGEMFDLFALSELDRFGCKLEPVLLEYFIHRRWPLYCDLLPIQIARHSWSAECASLEIFVGLISDIVVLICWSALEPLYKDHISKT